MKSWLRRVWARRPWRKRPSDCTPADPPLREFIYLDEVSVYSLLASRRGAVPSEQTDSETAQLRHTVDSEIGASAPVARATTRSQFETTSSRGTQVIRKSIIQSTFKDLVDLEQHRMKLRDGVKAGRTPTLNSEALMSLEDGEHVLKGSSLRRGDLLELEVELTPEDVFTASQIVKSMFTFFEEMPNLFSLDPEILEQGRMIDSVFDRLLVGLVPIRARSTRYRRLVLEDHEFLVSESLLGANPTLQELDPEPIYVVGVAERELFWRDLRRVLFSASPFFVMGRLSRDGLGSQWSPIKMANVFERQVPEIAKELDGLPRSFLDGMQEGLARRHTSLEPEPRLALTFAEKLAQEAGETWSVEDSAAAGLDAGGSHQIRTLADRRAVTGHIVSHLESRLGRELDPVAVARLRGEVFDSPQEDKITADGSSADQGAAEAIHHLLETEIVAIYW